MLVSLTSRETAIGTNDPPRLTLGWLSSRLAVNVQGIFNKKNQGIPTAGDVIFLDLPNRRSLEVVLVRNVRMIRGWNPNKSLER